MYNANNYMVFSKIAVIIDYYDSNHDLKVYNLFKTKEIKYV